MILVFNYKKQPNSLFLVFLYLITILYAVSHFALADLKATELSAFLINHFTPLYLTAGPLLFFYVRGMLFDRKMNLRKDLLHFLPALIQLLSIVPYILKPFSFKVNLMQKIIEGSVVTNNIEFNVLFNSATNFTIRLFSVLVYIFLSARLVYLFKKKYTGEKYKSTQLWIVLLLSFFSLLVATYLVFIVNFFNNPESLYSSTNTLLISLSGLAFMLTGITPVFFPHILYGYNIKIGETVQEYTKANVLPSAYYLNMGREIDEIFEHNKPHLEKEYKLDTLAYDLNAPKHKVNECFRVVYNTTFTAYKTAKRIKWVIDAFKDPAYESTIIDDIGKHAGFNSKSHFYKTFKKETGLSPKEYKMKFIKKK